MTRIASWRQVIIVALALQLPPWIAAARSPVAGARSAWASLQSAESALDALLGDPAAAEAAIAAAQERVDRARLEFLSAFTLKDALSISASSKPTGDEAMVRRSLYLGSMRASGESIPLALRACDAILDRHPASEEATAIRIAILPQLLNQDGSPIRAAKRLRQLAEVAPRGESPVIRVHRADALAMSGDVAGARRELEGVAVTVPSDDAPGIEWAVAGAKNRLRVLGSTLGPISVTRLLAGSEMPRQTGWMVLHYWEPWCGPCVADLPEYNRLWSTLSGSGATVIGITADTRGGSVGVASAASLADRLKLTCPIVLVDEATTARLGVESRPVTLIIDPRRVVRFASSSSGDAAVIEHAARMLLPSARQGW